VDRADPGKLAPRIGRQPAEAFRLLRGAGLLGGHGRYLAELVVGDRHRHEPGVLGPAPGDGLGHIGQQAIAWRTQLSGPGSAALHVPLEVEALGEQEPEVLAQGQLVDLVVAEATPDEHNAGPPGQRGDRPEPEVVAPEHVVTGEVMLGEDIGKQQRIGVRAVTGQEDQGVLAVQRPPPVQPGGVDLHVPCVGVQRTQRAGQQVDRDRAHRGNQAVQVRLGAPHRFLLGQAKPGREMGDLGAEVRAVPYRLGDFLRHLVPVPEQRSLGSVQRESGLPGHKLGERAGATPPAAQHGHGGGLRDHHPGPVRLAPHDPALPERRRPPWVDL
jgi:hypothetical protein